MSVQTFLRKQTELKLGFPYSNSALQVRILNKRASSGSKINSVFSPWFCKSLLLLHSFYFRCIKDIILTPVFLFQTKPNKNVRRFSLSLTQITLLYPLLLIYLERKKDYECLYMSNKAPPINCIG